MPPSASVSNALLRRSALSWAASSRPECFSLFLIVGFREDILKKLAKAQEPPPAKLQKALPAPDMNTKKKRGGKRVRKQKDRYTMSETRKAANRVGFGEVRRLVYFPLALSRSRSHNLLAVRSSLSTFTPRLFRVPCADRGGRVPG